MSMEIEDPFGDPGARPVVMAGFWGTCAGLFCGGPIEEGDEIVSDGEGGWLCIGCAEDDQ